MIDFDASTDTLYRPLELNSHADPYEAPKYEIEPETGDGSHEEFNRRLLTSPKFHCQNVYAIVMRVLSRFEFALGRRVRWSFMGHQIFIAPHALLEANAFYSKEQRALIFGYFPSKSGGTIFTCLAHDVIAHETTHALLDGLRARYIDPSSPDQAAFHEGFADIVAILSILSLPNVVEFVFRTTSEAAQGSPNLISKEELTVEKLRASKLLAMADQVGQELSAVRGQALRRSAELIPDSRYMTSPEFEEPHRRGEILVAAVLNAFLAIWVERIHSLRMIDNRGFDIDRVVHEGAEIADYLLTMCIRAIDYAPPTDILFRDFLSAILTADSEVHADDSKYNFRKTLKDVFQSYGITPTSKADDGLWEPPDEGLDYGRIHLDAMHREGDEVFRFLWHNRRELKIHDEAYTRVISVRPCLRIGPDGFALRETVAEYIQTLEVRARELGRLGITKPAGIEDSKRLFLFGGGALIFDEFCRLKYHVRNQINNQERQTARLDYLWRNGSLPEADTTPPNRFAAMHRMKLGYGRE